MEKKIELLKELIEISQLNPQLKMNLISQTLQRTEDIMKASITSKKILTGDFSTLKEEAINNLIGAFAGTNEEQTKESKSIISDKDNDDIDNDDTDNQTKNLQYELKTLKLQLEAAEYRNKKIEDEKNKLAEENDKFRSILTATTMFELIEVPDRDINELYVVNLQDNSITEIGEAFILDEIIPKTYYKINKIGGENKC